MADGSGVKTDAGAEIRDAADRVGSALDADVILFSGPLLYPIDDLFLDLCASRKSRTNVALVIATYGGDADVAYRIARCLQRSYTRVHVLVNGACKSAGTLLTLCSNEIVLSDYAELGPLDVQLLKDDEIGGRRSGLAPTQALLSLAGLSFNTFRDHFLKLRFNMQLTTKMSAQIASEMAIGVFRDIYGQIDPMRMGEIDRAMAIAEAYGERLVKDRGNAKPETLSTLLAGYPSHEFVIDRQEAQELFNCARSPSPEELELFRCLMDVTRLPVERPAGARVEFLGTERKTTSVVRRKEKLTHVKRSARKRRAPAAGADQKDVGVDRPNEQDARTVGKPRRLAPVP